MEPLGQIEETESTPPEEAVVASICSATKQLQESVQDLCKASLEKITYICQYIFRITISNLIFHLCVCAEQWSKPMSRYVRHMEEGLFYPN